MAHPFFDLPRPLVFGHRGASGEAPENTLPAFERALEQGAAILETDVHLTRDGVVVICHDAELARTTDGRGPIRERSFAELQTLDAGHHFSPDGGRTHPWRGRGARIPSLHEAFEAFPGIRFNIELKHGDPALIDATLDLVADSGREKLCLIAAGEDRTMQTLRGRLAESELPVAQGASPADVAGFVHAMLGRREPPPEPMALQIPPAFAGRSLVTPEFLDYVHAQGVQVHVWTVNERSEMERLLDLGVDGVMSDLPGLLHDVVAERRARQDGA